MALRRADHCSTCTAELPAGTRAVWDAQARTVSCLACRGSQADVPRPRTAARAAGSAALPEDPPAGGSAQQQYEARRARYEERVQTRHPRLGRLLLALTEEPASVRVWAQGAAGERAVGARLDELTADGVVALHDRRLRRPDGSLSKGNIDHIAVTAAGVWVVDAKTHQGALEVRRSSGLFGPRVEALYINGRDRTQLVRGLLDQVEAVRHQLAAVQAPVPVRGALCFVGTELPWFGSSSIVDVPLVGRRGLAKLLRASGDLDNSDRDAVAAYLADRFPTAVSARP